MPFMPPAGVTGASTATPITIVSTGTPAALLCDWIDPKTGDIKNPFASISPIVAKVQHAFTVRRKSGASVQDTGHEFHKITQNDDTALQRAKDEVARIAKPFVDAGEIRVDSVVLVNDRDSLGTDDMMALQFNFYDLIFGQPGSLTLGA